MCIRDRDTLSDEEAQYTIFAPTNEAFEAAIAELGLADASELLASEQLEEILLNHVVATEALAEAAVLAAEAGETLVTAGGGELPLELGDGGELIVGGATVIDADLEADNGVVHVIDAVLLP